MKWMLALIFFSLTAFATEGNEGGAGGLGLIIDGKPYLVDLVEFGVEKAPYVDTSYLKHHAFPRVRAKVAETLGGILDDEALDIFTAKLLHIHFAVGRVLSHAILWGVGELQWFEVSEDLFNAWLRMPAVQVPAGRLVTLALRRDLIVRINRVHFQQMTAANRAALILHEVLFALTRPYEKNSDLHDQNGVHARTATGALFTRTINQRAKVRSLLNYPAVDGAPLNGSASRLLGSFRTWLWSKEFYEEKHAECRPFQNSAREMVRGESLDDLLKHACPLVADELYATCRLEPQYSFAEYFFDTYSYEVAPKEYARYLRYNFRDTSLTKVQVMPQSPSPVANDRAECIEFYTRIYPQVQPWYQVTSIFDAP